MKPPQYPGLKAVPINVPPTWFCQSCKHGTPFPTDLIQHYLSNTYLKCCHCGVEQTVWDVVLGEIRRSFTWNLFSPLGAVTTLFQSRLFLGSETRLELHDHGLPTDAHILDVTHTGIGMFCFELQGGNRRSNPHRSLIQLYGFHTFTSSGSQEEADVNIAATWVHTSPSDFAWDNLVAAFSAYANDRITDALVPANVAVESTLHRLMVQEIGPVCGQQRLDDFLSQAATYSHQLNVMLPLITQLRSLPPMDDNLRGQLNRLRSLRNQVAHRGHTVSQFSKSDCAEVLCAALHGFRYMRYLIESSSP